MAKNLVNSQNIEINENGDNISLDLVQTIKDKIGLITNDNYSTDEIDTGKLWIDNKKIYRKVLNTGQLSGASGSKQINSGLSNVSVINMYGYAKRTSDNTVITLPNSANSYLIALVYKENAGQLYINTQSDMTAYTVSYVILEYIKN